MEELRLEDLAEIGEDNLNIFPDNAGEDKTGADNPSAQPEEKNNIPSDDSGGADQESVAKDKDDNGNIQVQAGKTSEEGGDSSSPKLNETEQLYSKLATQFKNDGALPGLEDVTSIKSMEDLSAAISREVEGRFNTRSKTLEDAMKAGLQPSKINEQIEVIDKLKSITPEYISSDDASDFRRTAIIQDALSRGYSQERSETMAQRSIDAGTDVIDAAEAVRAIIVKEETELQGTIQAAKDSENKNITDIKNYIGKDEPILGGIKLSKAQGDELYKQITTDLGNKENAFMQSQKKDPIGSRVKLEALFYLTKGLTDFSVFGNAAETKISNDVENLLRGASFTQQGRVETEIKDSNSTFSLSDLKDLQIE
jgi:hypothetical protein